MSESMKRVSVSLTKIGWMFYEVVKTKVSLPESGFLFLYKQQKINFRNLTIDWEKTKI